MSFASDQPPAISPRSRRWRRFAIAALVITVVVVDGAYRHPTGDASGTALSGPPATQTAGEILHVATFNIAGGVSPIDNRLDLDRTASFLHGLDLVALEEVHENFPGEPDQAQTLGKDLGLPWLFAPVERRWWHDSFGNGMLTDLPVKDWQRIQTSSKNSSTNRNLIRATVVYDGRPLTVVLSHLDRHADHDAELKQVIAAFYAAPLPAILLGDLNTTADQPQLRALNADPTVLNALTLRSKSPIPDINIDWIFTRGLRCLAAGLTDNTASDHRLAWADLESASDATTNRAP
jgi:endonuclease/exonuclease/phosphatase family metal-dependent hydrolase